MMNYVAVFPDGTEYFDEFTEDRLGFGLENMISKAVLKSGIKTSRYNPQTIRIEIFTLKIKDGKLVRSFVKRMDVQPPPLAMTSEEFEEEMKKVLDEIPEEFHSFIKSESWESGHSSGREEVISLAQNLISDLKPCIGLFQKRILDRSYKQVRFDK